MHPRVAYPGILIVALVARLAAAGASVAAPGALALRPYGPTSHPCASLWERALHRPVCAPLAEDESAYDALGRSIAAGHGYVLAEPWVYNTANAPTAYGNFLYPAFVGAVYALTGGSALALVVLQVLLGSFAVLALAVAARELAGERSARAVGLVAALHPGLVLSSVLVMTEALEVPILVALFLVWTRFARAPSGRRAALVGALAAAACLTRSPALYAVPGMVVATLAGREARATLRPRLLLGVVLVAALLMLPWSVRNAVRFGAFVPADTKAGAALWLFNHPSPSLAREVWTGLPDPVPPPAPLAGLNEAQTDAHFRGLAMRYVAGAPVAFVEASLLRFGMFLVPVPRNWEHPVVKGAVTAAYVLVTWLGLAGLWFARRTLTGRALLGLGTIWIALLSVTSTGLRFRLPVEWVLAFGTGLVLAELWGRIAAPPRTAAAAVAGAARAA